jgi:hypothetical protein
MYILGVLRNEFNPSCIGPRTIGLRVVERHRFNSRSHHLVFSGFFRVSVGLKLGQLIGFGFLVEQSVRSGL